MAFGRSPDDSAFVEPVTLSGRREIHWIDAKGRHGEAVVSGLELPQDGLARVRTTKGYFHSRAIGGRYYWPRTKVHVWCESQEEMKALTWFDYEGFFIRAYAQPFAVIFERGAGARHHVPDFLFVDQEGGYTIVNVRPLDRVDEDARRKFELMAETCQSIGWGYMTFTGLNPVREANLAWLKSSRHSRCAPPAGVAERALALTRDGTSRGRLARGLDLKLPMRALPWIDHLLWHRALYFDIDQRLDSATLIFSTEDIA